MTKFKRRTPTEVMLDTLTTSIEKGALKDVMPELSGPIKMQGKRSDGNYRTATVNRGDEFMMCGVRLHARGDKVIFEFKSDDPSAEFEQYELDDTKVFIAFPDLESLVVRVLGYDAIDTDDNPVHFHAIKGHYLKKVEELEEERIEQETKVEEDKSKSHYEDHPLFGVWG